MDKRANRSDSYQALYHETRCSNEMMESFGNEDSISVRLNPFQYNEDLIDLEEELKKEFWRIAGTLTERQQEVLKMLVSGKTQMEIAKALGVNQSSVAKSLQGNIQYSTKDNVTTKKGYGGSKKRLKKLIDLDPRIKDILDRMAEIRESKW